MADVLGLRLGPRKGCRRAPSALALYSLGCALEKHDPKGAATAYRRAIAARPDLADAHNNLGRLHHADGDTAAAAACYRRAIAADGNVGLYHYNLGVALEDQRDLEPAILAYRAALTLEPRLAEAHWNLAGLLGRAGDPESQRNAVRHLAQYRSLRRVS